ncbi:MAG: helix-turn-helix transcriptional regulator [Sutterella parvirubra]|uniref:DNA-binding helix-turn-helix protein n=1 Tax=Sutterella parvirubra YIT 11816 TaxID=762967 RepID=H3KCP9_9BURK|nr:helix-turn-helix transcriptional regulator [Sutterella parvirubra]EHY32112.1 DNA-binding helix-turn-helix protein [Sutterella parvirubra YIT 11816]MDR3770455.1 helix-turn-helix transcriptional regulator [Sutterella sp.]MDY5200678.1 helix-turn-helix transcriptional regulator [Sutterella parvirubra]
MLERRQEPDGGVLFTLKLPPLEAQRADLVEAHLQALVALLESAPAKGAVPEEPPGITLKMLRKDAGLTQVELARLAGTTQSRISDMESGVRPFTAEAAKKLSEYFGVPVEWFIRR